MPEVDSLAELNARIDVVDEGEDRGRIAARTTTIGQDFEVERAFLLPFPNTPFEAGLTLQPLVDRYSRIGVRTCWYSVPCKLIGRRVRVCLRASGVVVFDGRHVVARHERLIGKGGERLVLDHYLEVLVRKPGALPGATALVQARESGMFTPAHDAFWSAARRGHGDAAGTRALVEVLLLHRHVPHADVVAGLQAAVSVGATTAEVVAIEARRAHDKRRADGNLSAAPPMTPSGAERVVSLTERRLINARGDLPADTRSLPSVEHYDELLTRPGNPV